MIDLVGLHMAVLPEYIVQLSANALHCTQVKFVQI
jgi:hypothetical protein